MFLHSFSSISCNARASHVIVFKNKHTFEHRRFFQPPPSLHGFTGRLLPRLHLLSFMAVCLSEDNNNMTLSQELPPHFSLSHTHTLKHMQCTSHASHPLSQHQPSHTHKPSPTTPCPSCPPPCFAEAPACPGCTPGSLAPPCWMEEAMIRLSKSDLPQLFSVT